MNEIEIRHKNFHQALKTLESNAHCQVIGDINSKSDFNNNVKWITGEDENGLAITTETCPYSLTWTQIKAEMDKL